ncbi:DNA-binding proteins Bright/BRCAA1/RBP1 and related proteins containing BRIGHT domain, partial [Scheffersomyces stipitis CBS 6054]
KKLLSTSSPEGIQVASKITPTRLANLLIRKGPLPIRHITGHLAVEVPSFDQLSLSKQRRLIMAAMEQTDPSNNVVFEKIGWGQWAVRKVDSDFIVTEGTESTGGEQPLLNVNDLRNQTNLKLGWSKKQNVLQNSQNHSAKKGRRESITNNVKNLHNLKLPNEPAASTAIASDSEDDEYDHLSDNMEQDNEDTPESSSESEEEDDNVMFSFDQDQDESANNTNRFKRSPPIKFAKRVPIKVSPPPSDAVLSTSASRNRRKSSSSNPASSFISKPSTYRHQLFNRSRLNSLDNLDNYLISSAKNSQVSINSPPPISSFQSPPNMGTSPINSWNSNYIHATSNDEFIINNANNVNAQNGHRKSSFNESHIRSTLSSSLPMGASLYPHNAQHIQQTQQSNHHQPQHNTGPYDNSAYANSTPSVLHSSNGNASDTDEEDWATIGAESLRKHHLAVSGTRPSIDASSAGELNDEEKSAAFALVDLMSV